MSVLGKVRRRVLTPNVSETSLDVRGFHVKSAETRQRLETVGRSFLTGYALAAEAGRPTDAENGLAAVPASFRGFAYEGAAMAFAVRDGLPVGGRHHVADFLTGRADRHVYMVYVGVGWAMARVPKFRWSTLYAADPLLRWLILDGYGFHQAYFRTRRYVYGQQRDASCPWPEGDHRWYAGNVIDQGVGRATWFVGGTDPELVARLFDRFAEDRRADPRGSGHAAQRVGHRHLLRHVAGGRGEGDRRGAGRPPRWGRPARLRGLAATDRPGVRVAGAGLARSAVPNTR